MKDFEDAFCRVMKLDEVPENFRELKIGSIKGWGSLSHMNLFLELEEKFNIRFSIEEMTELSPPKTVEDLETVTYRKLSENSQ